MAVERRDPLPPGHYWQFIRTDELPQWQAWLTANYPNVVAKVSETLYTSPDNVLFAYTPTGELIRKDEGEVVLFTVRQPVKWVGLGFPTILQNDPGIAPYQALAETAKTPKPEEFRTPLEQLWAEVKTAAFVGLALFIGIKALKK